VIHTLILGMNLSHWQALIPFNTIFDHLIVAYFLDHPVYDLCSTPRLLYIN